MTSEDGRTKPAYTLLVEDNTGDIRVTEEALKTGKIADTLHVVEDGVEALDFLSQRNDSADAPRPDLVLLDLSSPDRTSTKRSKNYKMIRAAGVFRLSSSQVRKAKWTSSSPTSYVQASI